MTEQQLPKELKKYLCMYTIEGHRTYRLLIADTMESIEHQLKTGIGKNKVTGKRFYEIDRLTGNFEEF